MQITNQVCSLDQARELHELGVRCESLFYWVRKNPDSDSTLMDQEELTLSIENCRRYPWDNWPAYTCAELGVMLGKFQVVKNNQFEEWDLLSDGYPDSIFLRGVDSLLIDENGDGGDDITESQVRGAALIWLIKSGHIKAEDVKL